MRGLRNGARALPWYFNIRGTTALLIGVLILYTYRAYLFHHFLPLPANRSAITPEGQLDEENKQKPLDLDADGLPDLCFQDENLEYHCWLPDGSWTTIPADGFVVTSSTFLEATESVAIPTQTTVEVFTTDSVLATDPSIATGEPSSSQTTSDPIATSTITSPIVLPTGSLPSPERFRQDNGTRWKIEYVGDIGFTGVVAEKNMVGDKCRSSKLGDKIIWNCGDMWCDFDYTICGFAMGPAMYGTDDVMTINTTGVDHIYHWDFLQPHESDPEPELPFMFWGMDTSNVAPINETHGVAYGFEVWRGAPGENDHRCGNAVASVTLGDDRPIAARLGSLLTGPDAIEMGMLAILRDGEYVYIYSEGGSSNLIVTRVLASDDVFDAYNYQSLEYGSDEIWSPGIPSAKSTIYGMTTSQHSGVFGCSTYGSVFYNNYLNKYVIICNIYMLYTNMYTSDTPWGPWSEEYPLLRGWNGYGSMAHPQYSREGSHKEFYFSQGPNERFNMFKVSFGYDDE